MKNLIKIFILIKTLDLVKSQFDPHFLENRSGIVHLFEWKWIDIGKECENFLSPHGYGGVQISPANENSIIETRPWWERYQPISYKLITRSGDENDLKEMIERCNNVGIRIYVDVIFNHMGLGCNGTGGSIADLNNINYPNVPYIKDDFHENCKIQDYKNAAEVRNCRLVGLPDLDQGLIEVQQHIINYLNKLIEFGVAGFRIDAAKHMWPNDLLKIYSKLNNLNVKFFKENSRPFIIQEVIDEGNEAIKKTDYIHLGTVTEFSYSENIGRIFHGNDLLKYLINWGVDWGFLDSKYALVFIDNHDNQRNSLAEGSNILCYKKSKEYKMANAFMLSSNYGIPRIMSSFDFKDSDHGPPMDENEMILSPKFNLDGSCNNGWICEHRWREIYNMIKFRNIVKDTEITDWWDNGKNQIAFCRENKGFIVFNNEDEDLVKNLQTCLPQGRYCDIISGNKIAGSCTGHTIHVDQNGQSDIFISGDDENGVIAIHIESRI